MATCIWCKRIDAANSIEHIIPEALGCPPEFVLTDGAVCRTCNNGLSHLDQAVIEDFDFPAYFASVPRKGGRPPEIRGRGNVIATKAPNENAISINMERYPVTAHDGTKLGAYGKSRRNVDARMERVGDLAKVSFSTTIGSNPKFIRGIVKIGLSSLACFVGAETVLAEQFDPIRDFVRHGHGSRSIILTQGSSLNYFNKAMQPYISEIGGYAVIFRLAMMEFYVDLTSEQTLFPVLKLKMKEMYGASGWGYLPIDPKPDIEC